MSTVCRKAHDNAQMLPDDWRYEFIEQAVDALAEHEDADAARDSLEPGRLRGVKPCSAAHNAVGLAGESPVVGIDCLPT